jgi:Xaa-Pro aminopeptidase
MLPVKQLVMMNNLKLKLLREKMKDQEIDAYLIPITDPHLGEYLPGHWRIIEWLTGFTGSAANVVVTAHFAGLWTDSRYFIQAENELKDSGFELVKLNIPHTPEYIDWLEENLGPDPVIAVDGRILPVGTLKLLNAKLGWKNPIIQLNKDLVSGLWTDRPPMPDGRAFEHETRFTGESREEKIRRVRSGMKKLRAGYHLITSLDDIAWLLNIRGSDVSYSPLLTAYVLLSDNSLDLFVDPAKIPHDLENKLANAGVKIYPYHEAANALKKIEGSSILITPGTTSAALYYSLPADIEIIEEVSVPTRLKAIKNSTEIRHIKNVMVKDGVALTKFFYWLDKTLGKEKVTEISAADKLLSFRLEQENCQGASFATIAAYNEHGASPHYCSTAESDVELKPEGIFLLDSGGQYLDGTTDVTRTIALAKPTVQQKTDFTLALKGTINLALVKFPLGTKGYQVEILARKALWDRGMNYGHGTGHGVGFFLNVHEGPQTIGTGASGDMKTIFEPGMLTADEPAIYREGEYGFRTENLILCIEKEKTEYGQFLGFETVTLACIDTSLIDTDLLTGTEKDWITSYHKEGFSKLKGFLRPEEAEWLENKCRPV